jgi:hypothetical protein
MNTFIQSIRNLFRSIFGLNAKKQTSRRQFKRVEKKIDAPENMLAREFKAIMGRPPEKAKTPPVPKVRQPITVQAELKQSINGKAPKKALITCKGGQRLVFRIVKSLSDGTVMIRRLHHSHPIHARLQLAA